MVPPPESRDSPKNRAVEGAFLRRLDEELLLADFTAQTRMTYRGHLRRFLRWAGDQGERSPGEDGELPPGESAVRRYLLHLLEERGLLRVRQGKGRRNRVVMLSEVALEAIRDYRELESSSRWLFPGTPPGHHISKSAVQAAFVRAREAAGIEKRVGTHSLRHSFATHLLESGTGLRHIQALLGHASVESTQIYTRVARRDLAAIRSPLDSLEEGEPE